MSTLKTFLRGTSITIAFQFPESYDLQRIESISAYLGSKVMTAEREGRFVYCRMKSSETKDFGTINKLTFWVDDSILGVQKIYVGDVCFDGTNAIATNDSVNTGVDLAVSLTVSETTISVDSLFYDMIRGEKGERGIQGEKGERGDVLDIDCGRADSVYTPSQRIVCGGAI